MLATTVAFGQPAQGTPPPFYPYRAYISGGDWAGFKTLTVTTTSTTTNPITKQTICRGTLDLADGSTQSKLFHAWMYPPDLKPGSPPRTFALSIIAYNQSTGLPTMTYTVTAFAIAPKTTAMSSSSWSIQDLKLSNATWACALVTKHQGSN